MDTVDELIDLVTNWNAVHCQSSKSKSKKRAHPTSISMTATPAKKSKLNGTDHKISRNCLFDLEAEARTKLCELTTEAIKTVYDVDLDEKQQHELLYSGLARPSHGRGEVTLPCFRLSKPLKSKPNLIAEKIVAEISKAIASNTGVLFLSNPFLKVEAANGRINAYLNATYLGMKYVTNVQIRDIITFHNLSYNLCGFSLCDFSLRFLCGFCPWTFSVNPLSARISVLRKRY